MYKLILLLVLFSFATASAQKQSFDKATFYSFGLRLYAEAHTLPDSSPDSVNILILFKVVHEALVYIQTNPLENPGNFQAIPAIEVFYKDNSGIIKNRTLWTDTIWAKTYEDTKSKDLYVQGFITTKMPAADYKCTVQLLDRYRKPADKTELDVKSNKEFLKKAVVADPVFTFASPKMPEYKSIPFILGNKINFTSSDSKILIPVSYESAYNVFNYTISKKIDSEAQFWNDTINISGRVTSTENGYLEVEKNENFPVVFNIKSGFRYNEKHDGKIFTGVLSVNLPSEQLSPGNYTLTLITDGKKDTTKYDFDVIWVDMPLALRNPAYAVESMYYILNDEEYDEMKSGNDAAKSIKIMKYWKAKDPTKQTPYNEAMSEYFKRVDYAFFNYQTVKEKDGSKSERGKIYILHGKPDKTDKTLKDGKQYEIWTYDRLKKVFYFELVSNGLWVLTKIDG